MVKERYNALDGIRAYAILGIAIMHIRDNCELQIDGFFYNKLIPSFTNFVFLFMAVSAFGMCCGYYTKMLNGEISLEKFYSSRYAKIWPFFALLTCLDIVVSPSKTAIYEGFANLTLCFGLLPNANIGVIGVGWTLGVIFTFYLLFPFFCYLLSNKKRAWFAAVIALIFNLICHVHFSANRANIIFSAVYFLAGGIIYLYRNEIKNLFGNKKIIMQAITLIAILIYFCFSKENPLTMLLVCCTILSYSICVENKGILINSFTRFMSSISFEIYLSHMLIYRVIEKLPLNNIVDNDVILYVITCVGTIVGAVIFSVVAQWGIKMIKRKLENK